MTESEKALQRLKDPPRQPVHWGNGYGAYDYPTEEEKAKFVVGDTMYRNTFMWAWTGDEWVMLAADHPLSWGKTRG